MFWLRNTLNKLLTRKKIVWKSNYEIMNQSLRNFENSVDLENTFLAYSRTPKTNSKRQAAWAVCLWEA